MAPKISSGCTGFESAELLAFLAGVEGEIVFLDVGFVLSAAKGAHLLRADRL